MGAPPSVSVCLVPPGKPEPTGSWSSHTSLGRSSRPGPERCLPSMLRRGIPLHFTGQSINSQRNHPSRMDPKGACPFPTLPGGSMRQQHPWAHRASPADAQDPRHKPSPEYFPRLQLSPQLLQEPGFAIAALSSGVRRAPLPPRGVERVPKSEPAATGTLTQLLGNPAGMDPPLHGHAGVVPPTLPGYLSCAGWGT